MNENENNDNMEETKKRTPVWYLTVSLCLVIVVLLVAGLFGIEHYNVLNIENSYLSKEITLKSASYAELESAYNEAKGLINTQERLFEAEKQLDRARVERDIINYIREHYIKVSSVVAGAIADSIIELSIKHEIPLELVLGIMEIESWFNPTAQSKAGAIGLMQVMPEWVPKLKLKSKRDLYEVDINIDAGIRVLKIHITEEKGSIKKGLFKYVNKDSAYVNKVLAAAGKFTIFRQTKVKDSLSKKSSKMKVK